MTEVLSNLVASCSTNTSVRCLVRAKGRLIPGTQGFTQTATRTKVSGQDQKQAVAIWLSLGWCGWENFMRSGTFTGQALDAGLVTQPEGQLGQNCPP